MLARRVFARAVLFAAAALCLFATSRPATAQPADAATINRRVELGVKFLKEKQKPAGFWGDGTGPGPGKGWGVGYTALAGLALVECGVKVNDPIIKKAGDVVRAVIVELEDTYELALAILFLDRLKDQKNPNDKRYIQFLAGRLMAAQMPSGGWGYKAQKYSERDVLALVAGLRKLSDPKLDPTRKDTELKKVRDSLPEDMRRLAVIIDPGPGRLPSDPAEKRNDLLDATTDNSNTHFAMIGLWTARKYDVPVDRTFVLVNRRFRTSQGAGGSWSYDFARTGADGGPQHTCIALLGVAIGHVVAPDPAVKPEADPVILNAFVSLAKSVGEPVGDIQNRPKIKDIGGLYFLWTMERIAVLYDLQKLGKKDWYQWGAEILICNQLADGSWDESGLPGENPIVNTCLALMFLRRANLTPDLSKKLLVDTSVLTAKVDDKIAPKPEPKPEPPPPTPAVVEPGPIAIAPMPRTVEPKPEPKAEPPAPQAPQQETAAPAKKKTPWLFIILGMILAAGLGGGLAFLVAKRMKKKEGGEEGEEGEKKKKKGKKGKAEGDSGKPKKPKAKAEAEEEE